MGREWKSSVKSTRAVTNSRLYQYHLYCDSYKLYVSTSLYIYNYTVLNVIIWTCLFLVSPFLHILLFLHHLLLHHLLLLLLHLLLLLLHTRDLLILVNLSCLSIQFGQISGVLSAAVLLQLSVVVESVCAQASPRVFTQLKSLLTHTGLRQHCVPFKIDSTRWRC